MATAAGRPSCETGTQRPADKDRGLESERDDN